MCNSVSCAGNKIHEEENLVTQAEGGTQRGSCSQGKTRNLASSVCDKYVTLSLHTRSHSIQSIVLECLTTTNTFHPYTNLHIHSLASRAGAAPTVLQKLVSLVFWGCRRPLSLAGMSILEQLQFLSTCVLAFCLLRVGGQCAGNGSIVGEAVSFSSISRGRTLSLILPRARRKPFSVPRQL